MSSRTQNPSDEFRLKKGGEVKSTALLQIRFLIIIVTTHLWKKGLPCAVILPLSLFNISACLTQAFICLLNAAVGLVGGGLGLGSQSVWERESACLQPHYEPRTLIYPHLIFWFDKATDPAT